MYLVVVSADLGNDPGHGDEDANVDHDDEQGRGDEGPDGTTPERQPAVLTCSVTVHGKDCGNDADQERKTCRK